EKVSENARRAAVRSDWGFSRCLAERSGRTAYGEFLVISWSLAWLVDQDGALEPAMAGSLARCGQEDGMGAGYAVHKRPLSIEVERVAVPGALAVDLGDCAARPVQVKSEPDAVQAVRRRGADPEGTSRTRSGSRFHWPPIRYKMIGLWWTRLVPRPTTHASPEAATASSGGPARKTRGMALRCQALPFQA